MEKINKKIYLEQLASSAKDTLDELKHAENDLQEYYYLDSECNFCYLTGYNEVNETISDLTTSLTATIEEYRKCENMTDEELNKHILTDYVKEEL